MNKKLSKRRKRGRSQSCWSGELPLITSKSEYFIALSLFYLTSDSYGNPIVYPESDSLRSWQYTLYAFPHCFEQRHQLEVRVTK